MSCIGTAAVAAVPRRARACRTSIGTLDCRATATCIFLIVVYWGEKEQEKSASGAIFRNLVWGVPECTSLATHACRIIRGMLSSIGVETGWQTICYKVIQYFWRRNRSFQKSVSGHLQCAVRMFDATLQDNWTECGDSDNLDVDETNPE